MKIRLWAKGLHDLIDSNMALLGVEALFYGDQDKLPRGVVVCVEPFYKTNNIKASSWVADQEFEAHVYVYVARIDSVQTNRDVCDRLAEEVEDLIHKNMATLNGDNSIATWVDKVEFGYSTKETGIVRSARLIVHGKAQTNLNTL